MSKNVADKKGKAEDEEEKRKELSEDEMIEHLQELQNIVEQMRACVYGNGRYPIPIRLCYFYHQ